MLPDVAALPMGGVAVAWTASGEGEEGSAYVAFSSDGGRTFDKKVTLPGVACPCCPGSLVSESDGTCFFAYRAVFEGNERDPVVAVVRNRGDNVDGPFRLHMDHWKIEGCPANAISMALVEGGARPKIVAAWYSGGPNPGVYAVTGTPGQELKLEKLKTGTSAKAQRNPSIGQGEGSCEALWLEPGAGKTALLAHAKVQALSGSPRGGSGASITTPAASFGRGDKSGLAAWVESGRSGNVIRVSSLAGDGR
jgi:hypothetical protein